VNVSDINSRERRKLEQLLDMGGGYVLNFSDRTFHEFFDEFVGKDIDQPKYRSMGTSKANRLRSFWAQEPNGVVARCLNALLDHAADAKILSKDAQLVEDVRAIISRLSLDQPVADLDAISAPTDDRDFEAVAQAARDSIEKNQPEMGLDRLHTFLVKYVRTLCESRQIVVDRSVPLNGLFGAYVKALRTQGLIGSDMAERILKSSIANLEAFNHVRNQHSLAHDNAILNYDEALLIFNHVASTVRFVKAVEDRLKRMPVATSDAWDDDDIPF
jgi:hypothetical protein